MRNQVGVTHSDGYNIDAYIAALKSAGAEPVPISPKFPRGLNGLGGLVLCGGTDLNPALYGEARHPEAEEPERDLDSLEFSLLQAALDADLPILAICRGMQLFNVAHGGTLHQHIAQWPSHRKYDTPKSEPAHTVEVAPESRLAAIMGPGPVAVNSRHHQAVNKVGTGLGVSAFAEDGVIEGLERPDRTFAVAVQWHPENQAAADRVQAELFAAFVRALSNGVH